MGLFGKESKEVQEQCQETHVLWAQVAALAPQTEPGSRINYKSATLFAALRDASSAYYLFNPIIFNDLQCGIDTTARVRLARTNQDKELVIAVGPDKAGTPELQVILDPATYKLRGMQVHNPERLYAFPVSTDSHVYQPVTEQKPALSLLSLIKDDLEMGRNRWENRMDTEKNTYLEKLSNTIGSNARTATEVLIAQMEDTFPDEWFIVLGQTQYLEEVNNPVLLIHTTLDIDEDASEAIGNQYHKFRQTPYAESQDYHIQCGNWRGYFTQTYNVDRPFCLSLSTLPEGEKVYPAEQDFARSLAGEAGYDYGLDLRPVLLYYHTPDDRSFLTPNL